MKQIDLEYNSERELLTIPEYGRNVQKLINHCKTIEDEDERQIFAERIVELMLQMHPQNKNVNEYKERLWKHFFRIAQYDIDVKSPEGTQLQEEPSVELGKVEYPQKFPKMRHYGNNVKILVEKAVEMEDPEKQAVFKNVIGSYMKLAYKNWHREHFVSDEIVKNDFKVLAKGKLEFTPEDALDFLLANNQPSSSFNPKSKKKRSGGGKYGKSKGRSNNNRDRKSHNQRRRK